MKMLSEQDTVLFNPNLILMYSSNALLFLNSSLIVFYVSKISRHPVCKFPDNGNM